jgi:hypothetical protein
MGMGPTAVAFSLLCIRQKKLARPILEAGQLPNRRAISRIYGGHFEQKERFRLEICKKTYNSGDSLVVTDPTTNPPVSGLTMGERTGSRIFHYLWSYVLREGLYSNYSHGDTISE